MDIEKIGIHLRDKFTNGAIVGLTFMFDGHDPLDIDVSWINNGDALGSIKEIFATMNGDDPKPYEIDEEGESVTITSELSTDNPETLRLTFTCDRRKPFDTFTVSLNKQQFANELQTALHDYEQRKN